VNSYGFNDAARAVLEGARNDARRRQHEYVGTEHILSSLLLETDGIPAAVFRTLDIDIAAMQAQIDKVVGPGHPQAKLIDLPYTSRSRKVVELAMSEARELGHNYIGSEHILAGVIKEEKGIAAQILVRAGASLEKVRRAILVELSQRPGTQDSVRAETIGSVVIELNMTDGTVTRNQFDNVLAALRFLTNQ
jgi:ATP-dependent Clp protease ATP-binding subunit ClpC